MHEVRAVAFDCDGVLANNASSWQNIHEYFGTENSEMLAKFLRKEITDEEFVAAGARILSTADDVWATAEMVLKVKEPVAEEYHRMREGQTLFTYLHLAADKPLTTELLDRKVTGIALRSAP